MHRALFLPVVVAVYAVSWVGVWHVASAAALSTGTSLWYPPAALTFGLLAVWGPGWVWLPLAASLVAGREVWHGAPTVFELAGSLGHAASYAVAAVGFRLATRPPRTALTPRNLSRFLMAGLLGAGLSAALGTLNHDIAGLAPALPTGRAVVAWFAGDALGVASLAPFLVFAALPWSRRVSRSFRPRKLLRPACRLAADLGVVALATATAGFGAWMARVDVVPICALSAGGALIILTGRREPRQSLTSLAIAMSALAAAAVALPAKRELVEVGLVTMVSTLLTLMTLQQTLVLRRQRVQYASLTRQLALVRREHDTAVGQLERTKTRIAEVGHELRTPLNAILGYAGLIRMTAGHQDAKATAERAETIEHSAEFLLVLINDIVDSASLRLGRLSLQLQPTQPVEILRATVRMLQHRATGKDQAIAVDAPGRLPPVRADPVRLKQALVNLAQNAIKYSPNHARIALSARTDPTGDRVRLSVTDDGPGLSREELDLAVQPFTRAIAVDRQEGSGIGLPLAIELAREMGGAVEVDTAPGQGTAVHIRLPVAEKDGGPDN